MWETEYSKNMIKYDKYYIYYIESGELFWFKTRKCGAEMCNKAGQTNMETQKKTEVS